MIFLFLCYQDQLPVHFITETNKQHTILFFYFQLSPLKLYLLGGKMKKKILAGLKGNT